ncbi:DUF1014-domain-containing protein [Rhizodiscina lignyota]|uniref:DUF1014-domain-containing protein n=1 Tax=Rhizodiscina lignyota TaxID=1504668 RepID=A0A9P4IH84_9PEZI|nr:DUF1014-domain-containing protein [Rhizodiscina lignyota]
MAAKKGGENTKKAAGNARKAEAAAQKQAVKNREEESQESAKWSKGSKDNSKAEAAAARQAEAARKKAEKEALAKAEEASLPSKGGPSKTKTAQKKSRGPSLDLAALDGEPTSKKGADLNATGIDNALDALTLTSNNNSQIDRHPERRFKAAYAVFEERRLEEMKDEKGLRRQQKIELIRKEFEKHPDNPFNQISAQFNSTREELAELQDAEKRKIESRLGNTST